jgi:secreted trypsin-like serine protease
VRKVQTDTRLQRLYPDFLVLQNNAVNAGKGATCYGDSGGPVFLETNNRLIVGLTSFGTDEGCRVHSGFVRLDTQAARSFLANYVTLP